jgi:hypothetical protein
MKQRLPAMQRLTDKKWLGMRATLFSQSVSHANYAQCQDGTCSSSTQQGATPSSREAKGSPTYHRTRSRWFSLRYTRPIRREAHWYCSEMCELWTGRTHQNQQKVLPQLRIILGLSQQLSSISYLRLMLQILDSS